MKPWIFLGFLLLPAGVIAGNYLGEGWNFIVPVFCFLVHPLLNLLTRADSHAHSNEHIDYPPGSYAAVALSFVPVIIATTIWAVWRVGHHTLSSISITGLILSTGIMNGIIGFTLAHEFIHRQKAVARIAGHLLLLQNNYLHYSIEHIGGHHVYACTGKDPHTARINESFYRFLSRAIASTFRNAWEIECRRLSKKDRSFIGQHNRMLLFLLLHLFVFAAILLTGGWLALTFFLIQSMIAIGLLHITNYLQHYGLVREATSSGHAEKINAHHAWSVRRGKDGLNLFQLENHADHHIHPNRSYEQLMQHPDSPEMPTGYSGMIMLALLPPLWFRIMNKRIPLLIT